VGAAALLGLLASATRRGPAAVVEVALSLLLEALLVGRAAARRGAPAEGRLERSPAPEAAAARGPRGPFALGVGEVHDETASTQVGLAEPVGRGLRGLGAGERDEAE